MKQVSFEIFSQANCKWCDAAKALIDRKGDSYTEYNIHRDSELFRERFPNAKSVPQITMWVEDGEATYSQDIGGFEALQKHYG